MANILCLETATTNCSVAVAVKGACAALKETNAERYMHSEQLHVYSKAAVAMAGLTLSDLDAVAVSKGPGSYTGLRIGVSAAKGLCYALDLPLIAIPTLQSIAMQLEVPKDEVIIATLDARRMEVYSSVFNANYKAIRDTRAEIVNEDSFAEFLQYPKVHWVGNGAQKCKELLEGANRFFYPELVPSAKEMVVLAHQKYAAGTFEDVAYFEPYYLKDFVLQGGTKS
ncbi:MAG: tRNA (adenosine(37)-N6)-threonylcarbamoyltransferase complex dimerization subunit type 1 TsaB [Bacteroidota bacterium]